MYPHYAHAFPLSKVETVTADLMFELLLHITKIRLYPDNQAVPHWTHEIHSWLARIHMMATNVKTPTGIVNQKTFNKWLAPFATNTTMENMKSLASFKYGPPKINPDLSDTQERLSKIIPILTDPKGSILNAILILTK